MSHEKYQRLIDAAKALKPVIDGGRASVRRELAVRRARRRAGSG